MSTDERLQYEARVATRQAAIAALAAVCLIAAAVLQISGPHTKIDELTLDLIYAHKRFPLDLIGAVCNAIGLGAVAVTLNYLFGAIRARNPAIGSYVRWLAVAGASVAAIVAIAYAILIAIKSNDFVSHGNQTYQEAKQLTKTSLIAILPVLGQAASLLLAIGFVLTALGAMRVGLLTKFMGYLGIFVGVLVLFPIGSPVPVVQGFWLLALAYLLSGRWPTGVPPTWRTGVAERWPSTAELRAKQNTDGGAGRKKPAPSRSPATETVGAPAPTRTRAETSKRKRKRRR
jgi:hypothetical protein